ncbi:FAD/NAD(P)-binding protein [Catelliglobosispora koreensis]|uniref:FAD/NAD(P)-binding protein n=1 Tax=Catelliglobosispora koreensis TaxID=129052 RepID=UPI000A016E94|nr:FAD-dependent oxidoreductase [Catelliglobosispora koreensis]
MSAVVVGAGCSGVFAARELVRAGWLVVLIDPGARPGRGLAYGTAAPWHLLNSPVSAMSAEPDDPLHFLRWCRERDPLIQAGDFVPRAWYGDYLGESLRDADGWGDLAVHRGHVARVFEANGGGLTVLLADDVVVPAEKVVLAVGNPPPRQPFPVTNAHCYIKDPWRPGALDDLPEGDILLVGTGLTAVDVALTLGRAVTAISRHGLLPQVHAPHAALTVPLPRSRTLSGLLREIRGVPHDWQSVMDGLRPHWNDLWQRLSPADQQRFLRHVSRFWEVHRHRMAPAVASAVSGLMTVKKGEVCGVNGTEVITRGPEGISTGHYAAVINCTGPGPVTTNQLVRSLIADGLARSGPHGLGLDTDEHGALLGRTHRPAQIYTLGPARRGTLWETTAVPEIRAQARALAQHLVPVGRSAGGALGWSRADSAYPLPG